MDKTGSGDLVVNFISLKMDPALRDLVAESADENHVPMNEWVVQLIAEHFKRPDLAHVPRKSMGRPRKELANTRK